jgi:hypothetical protein
MLPQNQMSGGKAGPRTVTGFAKLETFGVEYTDDEGVKHTTVVQRMAGQWYFAPNGENFAGSLRPIKKGTWLADILDEKDAGPTTAASLPKDDAVNGIIG